MFDISEKHTDKLLGCLLSLIKSLLAKGTGKVQHTTTAYARLLLTCVNLVLVYVHASMYVHVRGQLQDTVLSLSFCYMGSSD